MGIMDNSSSIQVNNSLNWEALIEDIINEGSVSDAPAVRVTQVAVNSLESLVNQTTPESTNTLFELLNADPSLDFSLMDRHIQIQAKAFNWSPEQELYTLLVKARALKVKEEHIVSFISRNLSVIKKVFFYVLQNPSRENEWLLTLIPRTIKLNCTIADFTDEHLYNLRIYGVKVDSLFILSPILVPFRANNAPLLKKLLRAGCSVSSLFTPYAHSSVTQFFGDKIQSEMTPCQKTIVCLKELDQLGAFFEPDVPFEDDILVKVLMLEEPMDEELLAIFEKHGHKLAEKRQNGMTVLHWACSKPIDKNNTGINLIKNLLFYRFSPDDSGDALLAPPLKVLLDQKRANLVPYFIEYYVNLNIVVNGTTTLLHEVLGKCPRVSLEKVAPRLNVFMLDAEGRAPVDIAYENHNRQFFKQVIEPRCLYKFPQNVVYTKDAVTEILDKVFQKGMTVEALECALLYNVPEFTRKIASKMDFKEFSEYVRELREKHPQISASYLLNHFFVITSLTDFVESGYHPFLEQVLQLPCVSPVHYLSSVAMLIQKNEPNTLNFFSRAIPQDWQNGHFKNLRDHFEVFMEEVEKKDLSPEVKQELIFALMEARGLPQIQGKHPFDIIQTLAFEDYLKNYVRKDGSVQSAWEVLVRMGRLKECVSGAVNLLHDTRGKLNFKLVG